MSRFIYLRRDSVRMRLAHSTLSNPNVFVCATNCPQPLGSPFSCSFSKHHAVRQGVGLRVASFGQNTAVCIICTSRKERGSGGFPFGIFLRVSLKGVFIMWLLWIKSHPEFVLLALGWHLYINRQMSGFWRLISMQSSFYLIIIVFRLLMTGDYFNWQIEQK